MADSYHIKICSGKTGYDVKPETYLKLDLNSLKDGIARITGMRIRVGVPDLVLLEGKDGQIVNIYSSGRLLLRNYPSQEDVEKVVALIAPLLYGK